MPELVRWSDDRLDDMRKLVDSHDQALDHVVPLVNDLSRNQTRLATTGDRRANRRWEFVLFGLVASLPAWIGLAVQLANH